MGFVVQPEIVFLTRKYSKILLEVEIFWILLLLLFCETNRLSLQLPLQPCLKTCLKISPS